MKNLCRQENNRTIYLYMDILKNNQKDTIKWKKLP